MIHISKVSPLKPLKDKTSWRPHADQLVIYLFFTDIEWSRSQQKEFSKNILATILSNYKVPQQAKLSHNKSYTPGLIAIALAEHPIGIDIELIRADYDYSDILDECFSPAEIISLKENPIPNFFSYWTRKESFVKATREGITDDIKHVPCLDGTHHHSHNWYISTFCNENYCLSVTFKHPEENIKIIEVTS